MTTLVSANTRVSAWLEATKFLVDSGPTMNVVLDIASPTDEPPGFTPVYAAVDEFLAADDQLPLHSVAETIFPAWQYRRRGLRGLIEHYEREISLLQPGSGIWGSYADRIIRRVNAAGEPTSPLLTMIEKMRNESELRGPKKACYELDVTDVGVEVGIYRSDSDGKMRMGLPCLSHLSFKLHEGQVYLTALYRSHDYAAKALGNLLGLARLQACVAKEVGVSTGPLVIHSTYAWTRGSKGRIRALLDTAHWVLRDH